MHVHLTAPLQRTVEPSIHAADQGLGRHQHVPSVILKSPQRINEHHFLHWKISCWFHDLSDLLLSLTKRALRTTSLSWIACPNWYRGERIFFFNFHTPLLPRKCNHGNLCDTDRTYSTCSKLFNFDTLGDCLSHFLPSKWNGNAASAEKNVSKTTSKSTSYVFP